MNRDFVVGEEQFVGSTLYIAVNSDIADHNTTVQLINLSKERTDVDVKICIDCSDKNYYTRQCSWLRQ
jgi:hypothetical protein